MDSAGRTTPSRTSERVVTVAVCTRGDVGAVLSCLDGLVEQVPAAGWRPGGVLVVVNGDSPAGRAVADAVEGWARRRGQERPDVVLEARPGIPFARNRALRAVGSSGWLAFIDDDCVARPDWLAELTAAADRTGCDAVAGGWSIHPAATPSPWLPAFVWGEKGYQEAAFIHGPHGAADRPLMTAYTRNVMFRTSITAARQEGDPPLEFEARLASTGGSDTVFFHEYRNRGGAIVHCGTARVDEWYADARLTLRWHFLRRVRNAQGLLRRRRRTGEPSPGPLRLIASGVPAGFGLLRAGLLLLRDRGSPRARARVGAAVLKVALAVGAAAWMVGLSWSEYSGRWTLGRVSLRAPSRDVIRGGGVGPARAAGRAARRVTT